MRIVSLVPSATETLYHLGLWEQVVGITTFCTMPAEEVRVKTKVGGTKNPDIDRIVELQPDVVIMNSEENRKEHADALRERGLELHVSHPVTIEDGAEMIASLGRRFNAESRAGSLCEEITERLRAIHTPRRYRSLVLIWNDPYMTAVCGTYVDSVCRLFGFDNVIEEAGVPYPVIEEKDFAELQPDVLLLPDEPYAFREKHAQEIRQKYPEMPAVKDNRILLFDGMYITWHGFGTLRALREFPQTLKDAGLW